MYQRRLRNSARVNVNLALAPTTQTHTLSLSVCMSVSLSLAHRRFPCRCAATEECLVMSGCEYDVSRPSPCPAHKSSSSGSNSTAVTGALSSYTRRCSAHPSPGPPGARPATSTPPFCVVVFFVMFGTRVNRHVSTRGGARSGGVGRVARTGEGDCWCWCWCCPFRKRNQETKEKKSPRFTLFRLSLGAVGYVDC